MSLGICLMVAFGVLYFWFAMDKWDRASLRERFLTPAVHIGVNAAVVSFLIFFCYASLRNGIGTTVAGVVNALGDGGAVRW